MLLRSQDENSKMSTGLDTREGTSELHSGWGGMVRAIEEGRRVIGR